MDIEEHLDDEPVTLKFPNERLEGLSRSEDEADCELETVRGSLSIRVTVLMSSHTEQVIEGWALSPELALGRAR